MNDKQSFAKATGGHKTVADTWVSATTLRPLLQDDPCLVWLKLHGAVHGFQKDDDRYSFLNFIGDIGRRFEEKWVKEVAPEAVAANMSDHDVRNADSVRRTLELMKKGVPVITKAALWWSPFSTYGTADLIARASWLREQFPQLAEHIADGPDHYCVLDCKFQANLDTPQKQHTLNLDAIQVRLYGAMLGHLQGIMPKASFLICRDRPFDPLPVALDHRLDGPLDAEIVDLVKTYQWIARNGAHITPWDCPLVAPNWTNHEDAPWSDAKKRILAEFWTYTPVEKLAGIGRTQAATLRAEGVLSVEDLLRRSRRDFDLASLRGIGRSKVRSLNALLTAYKTKRPTPISAATAPPRKRREFFIDFEFLSAVNVDFENDWPDMKGHPMVFAIGIGWDECGDWRYRQFTAVAETQAAERRMWREFLRFLAAQIGVADGKIAECQDVVLYHWSPAEPSQARQAAQRLDMSGLAKLTWVDLRSTFVDGAIALPGQYDWGLKSVARALGTWSPEHRVDYPKELASGMGAMVMGWAAYASGGDPCETAEMKVISQYLETDCKSLWVILRWLRRVATGKQTQPFPNCRVRRCAGRRGTRRAVRLFYHDPLRNGPALCSNR